MVSVDLSLWPLFSSVYCYFGTFGVNKDKRFSHRGGCSHHWLGRVVLPPHILIVNFVVSLVTLLGTIIKD
ncbi:hypothetical protein VNO77_02433 [Canavalia gladiata]|uniref:Uncharacterized protein n=1 Tax=Canavalia gladiata TaxID=3824 RepID=A0AAN9R324_CANGL